MGRGYRDIYAMQYLLIHHGVLSGSPDGDFGPGTETALKTFQARNSLTADGVIGPSTWSRLIVTVAQVSYQTTAAKAVQDLLRNRYSYSITVDGWFGSGSATAL